MTRSVISVMRQKLNQLERDLLEILARHLCLSAFRLWRRAGRRAEVAFHVGHEPNQPERAFVPHDAAQFGEQVEDEQFVRGRAGLKGNEIVGHPLFSFSPSFKFIAAPERTTPDPSTDWTFWQNARLRQFPKGGEAA